MFYAKGLSGALYGWGHVESIGRFAEASYHLLRVPRFSYATLTNWYTSAMPHLVARVLQYHLMKVQLVIDLLDEAEIVSRNA